MTKDEVISLVERARENFTPSFKPESLMGWRYHDNDRVIRAIRMRFYEKNTFIEEGYKPLPKIDQVPDEWIRENINGILNEMCYADYHFSNKEKWL
jgi:hypothetical protein